MIEQGKIYKFSPCGNCDEADFDYCPCGLDEYHMQLVKVVSTRGVRGFPGVCSIRTTKRESEVFDVFESELLPLSPLEQLALVKTHL